MNSSGHADFGPELRLLAQTILDRLDPAVRAAATKAGEALRGPGRCEQVWCPFCALIALINGEQHPMLNLVAEHSVTLLTVVQAMAEAQAAAQSQSAPAATQNDAAAGAPDGPDTDAGAGAAPAGSDAGAGAAPAGSDAGAGAAPVSSNGRYHHIPIVVETVDPGA